MISSIKAATESKSIIISSCCQMQTQIPTEALCSVKGVNWGVRVFYNYKSNALNEFQFWQSPCSSKLTIDVNYETTTVAKLMKTSQRFTNIHSTLVNHYRRYFDIFLFNFEGDFFNFSTTLIINYLIVRVKMVKSDEIAFFSNN